MSAAASVRSLCIFQLPAMIFFIGRKDEGSEAVRLSLRVKSRRVMQ